MSDIVFQQATRTLAKARVGIDGPAGSGKTKTALIAAFALVGPQGKVFVIDTENNSASLYADEFPPFATFSMTPDFGYAPRNYIQAIEAAEKAGAEAIIVDSASHEWIGEGGALDMVDGAANASKSKNSYNAWNKVTPEHRKFMEKIIRSKAHIIATYRTKVEFEKNDKGGYDKVGLQAITRDGADYEFTVYCSMDVTHSLTVSKTRCAPMADKRIMKPDAKFFGILKEWLDGAKPEDLAGKVLFQEAKKAPAQPQAAQPAAQAPEAPKTEGKAPVAVRTIEMLVSEAAQYNLVGKTAVFGFLKEKGFSSFSPAKYDEYLAAFQTTVAATPAQ